MKKLFLLIAVLFVVAIAANANPPAGKVKYGKYSDTVYLGNIGVLSFNVGYGKLSRDQRANEVQATLNAKVKSGISNVYCVAGSDGYSVYLDSTRLIVVDKKTAKFHGSNPDVLAQKWAMNIIDAYNKQNKSEKTVSFGNVSTNKPDNSRFVTLSDMKPIGGSVSECNLVDNYGKTYSKGVYTEGVQYLLNGKYNSFKGTLAIPEDCYGDGAISFRVVADKKEIYSVGMTKITKPVKFDIPVSGVNQISIEVAQSMWPLYFGIYNAGFYKEQSMANNTKVPYVSIFNMKTIGGSVESSTDLIDNKDTIHSEAFYLPSETTEFLLDGKYKSFKGTLYIPIAGCGDDTCSFTVSADGEHLWSTNITKLSNPIDFNINVSGKNHLVIEKNSSEWRTWYVLTEAGFYN